jgi:hypothetical protein
MEKDFLIELTNKLYRKTLLFPKKEPLRYKIREAGIEVLTSWVIWEDLRKPNPGNFAVDFNKKSKEIVFEIEKELDVLDSYFEIAKWQNWVNFFEVSEIQKEYDGLRLKIKDEIKVLITEEEVKDLVEENLNQTKLSLAIKPERQVQEVKNNENEGHDSENLDQRKQKILEILKEKKQIQVWEANKVLPDVSKRTLRRDFQYLLKKGLIRRMGEKNNTFYTLETGKNQAEQVPASSNPISF